MRARHLIAVAALGLATCVVACKGGAKGLLGGSTCASGETANEDPPLCYRVPAGMTQKGDPIRRADHFQIGYQGEGGLKVTFLSRAPGSFDSTWKALQANARNSKASDAKEEELDGGKTRVLTYTTPGKDARSILSLVRTGPTRVLECEAEGPKGAPMDEVLAACKAIHEP